MKRIFSLCISSLIIIFFFSTGLGYAEDIVLTGNQVMLIENTTYTQDGNIFIRDNARLTISNSTLIFNQRYHGEFSIVVESNGTFEVIHSIIETGINLDESVTAFLFNEANVLVEYSDLLPGKFYFCFGGLHGEVYKGKASISNSKLQVLSITCAPDDAGPEITVSNSWMNGLGFRFDKNFQGDFQDLKEGFQSYWSYNQGNYDITIVDTTFTHLDLFCDGPAQITVRNSEITGIGCTGDYSQTTFRVVDSIFDNFALHGFSQKIVQLSNLKKGFHNYWSLRDHATGDYIPNVILENSVSIRGWLVTSYRATLSIDNSELIRFASHGCGSYSPTDISTITNSTVQELMLYSSLGTLIFDNTNIHYINAYMPSDAIIKGNITFDEDAYIYHWYNSVVTRNYPIFLRDQNENIISGAYLDLYSKNEELVWSGLTDNDGKANFDIEFNDNNYLDTWKLEVDHNGRKFYKDITLLTSTPITIPKYTVTISANTGGTTDPAPGTYTYDLGTEVSVTATPETGYRFSGWTGDVISGHENDNPITITMDSDKSVTANFIRLYTLTITAGTGGTTDPAPGSHEYDSGAEVTITATPENGYRFSGWSDDASGITNPITITMDSDKTIKANFSTIPSGDTGDEDGGGKKGGCFIATAAYGSPLHPHLDILRDFRDTYFMPSKLGSKLVDLYYKYSPFVANLIAEYKVLRIVIRIYLLPLVAFSYLMLYFGPAITAFFLGFIFVLPYFFVCFFRKRIN